MSRLVLGFLFITFAMIRPALAQDMNTAAIVEPVATIIEIEGDVAVKDANGKAAKLEIDSPIFTSDEVFTGPKSKALLLFIDDTQVTLGENAAVKIKDFTFEPEEKGKKSALISFMRGSFLFVTGKIDKVMNPDVTLETPYASIGIRGTTVWGGTLDNEYNVFVQDGTVSVRNDRGAMLVRTGEGTTITNRRTFPSRAKTWGETKINRAVATIALTRQEKIKAMLESRRGKLLEDRAARRALRKAKPQDGKRPKVKPDGEKLEKRGDIHPNNPQQRMQEKSQDTRKARNKIREEEFERRVKQQRDGR